MLVMLFVLAFLAGCSQQQTSQPKFSREAAIKRATEGAKRSEPEVGILEARIDNITAVLITAEDSLHGPGKTTQAWLVRIRGRFRFEGMPAPDLKTPIYEADERDFVYDAHTGDELESRIPYTR